MKKSAKTRFLRIGDGSYKQLQDFPGEYIFKISVVPSIPSNVSFIEVDHTLSRKGVAYVIA